MKVSKAKTSRSTKEIVSPAIIGKLTKLTVGHGRLKAFADKAELNYNTVYAVRKTGQATYHTLKKIKNTLKAA